MSSLRFTDEPGSPNALTSNRIMTKRLDEFLDVAKALSSELRIAMLQQLLRQSMTVVEIAEWFKIPQSTAAVNIKKLEDAGLIFSELVPGTRGTQKLCAATLNRIVVDTALDEERLESHGHVHVPMPIGHFFDSQVVPTCGIVSETSIIGEIDDARSFYEPDRTEAQLLWFRQGYVEYRFPNRVPPGSHITRLELAMEVCSEAPLSNPNWPSDITVWVAGVEIGTWTSPADFGGEKGLLTPDWFGLQNTQFGLLKTWRVTEAGSFVDGRPVSRHIIDELGLDHLPFIPVRIGVKEEAVNVGGLNLFGRRFGNYESDLMMRLDYVKANVK